MPRDLYLGGDVGRNYTIWRASDAGALTRLTGTLPQSPRGLTEHDGVLYAAFNEEPVGTETLSYLRVITVTGNSFSVADRGVLPTRTPGGTNRESVIEQVGSMVSHGGDLLIIARDGPVWRINPANPSDESGRFGRIADISGGISRLDAAASVGGTLYGHSEEDNPDRLYRIALGTNTAVATEIGAGPAGFNAIQGMTEHFGDLIATGVTAAGGRWTVNRTSPGSSTRTVWTGAASAARFYAIASHDPSPRRIGTRRIRARYLGTRRIRNRYLGSTRL